jgi:hypothetical protein
MAPRRKSVPMNYQSMRRTTFRKGRNGSTEIVTKLLADLDRVPLSEDRL